MERCKTCKHWAMDEDEYNEICNPHDSDTFEPMQMPFEVRECINPNLLFCERPLEVNGFAVADGSTYKANLYTAEDFGCIRWEAIKSILGEEVDAQRALQGANCYHVELAKQADKEIKGFIKGLPTDFSIYKK